MSEKYQKYSRSPSKSDKNKNTKRSRYYTSDSTTPPLPTHQKNSIEDLMKQRQSLREELKNITSSKSDLKVKENKKRKHERSSSKNENNKQHIPNKVPPMDKNDSSPEYTNEYIQLDSDDEESIIKQRRLQRKQLLDKLAKNDETIDKSNEIKSDHSLKQMNSIKNNQNLILKCKSINEKLITDMFSEEDFEPNNSESVTQDNSKDSLELKDNWDDAEGYYNIRTGDMINNSTYTIQKLLGQGVFSNVVKAQDNSKSNKEVAIKILRSNDLMYKTGLKELTILKDINDGDPEDKCHCVRFLTHFMHRGHLCLVLESLHMDLRSVIKKYGNHHGIHMKAIMSYSRQLLLALRFLKKIGIVHGDIKPDNILVNEKKNILKLCDFGSASKVDEPNEPTPYLVSRFYRAPEIILGIPYKNSVDVWSTACTIYEIATGKILFIGSSNNKMLKCFMDLKGKIPSRIIRKGVFKDQHFNYNNNYLLHKVDELTGTEKIVEISNIITTRDLYKELKKGYLNMSNYKETKIIQLKELLEKMLILDSNLRPSATDCLKHAFIQDTLKK